MPKTATTNSTTTTVKTDDVVADNDIEILKKENSDLKEQLNTILEMLKLQQNQIEENRNLKDAGMQNTEYVPSITEPEQPSPNKQIKVISLYYGVMNLADSLNGSIKVKFTKYGQTIPVLYSTLIDIVNANRRFAEEGRFYILDKSAVYHLGLSEEYKNLLPDEILNNIEKYNSNEIENELSKINDIQKESLIYRLATDIYNNKHIDLNKIDLISKIIGVDIQGKATEMRSLDVDDK